MDPQKIVEVIVQAGPGAGIGLAAGFALFIAALLGNRIVSIGRFTDMKDQRDKAERRSEKLEQANLILDRENSVLRVMMAGSLTTARRNADLTNRVMQKRVRDEAGDAA